MLPSESWMYNWKLNIMSYKHLILTAQRDQHQQQHYLSILSICGGPWAESIDHGHRTHVLVDTLHCRGRCPDGPGPACLERESPRGPPVPWPPCRGCWPPPWPRRDWPPCRGHLPGQSQINKVRIYALLRLHCSPDRGFWGNHGTSDQKQWGLLDSQKKAEKMGVNNLKDLHITFMLYNFTSVLVSRFRLLILFCMKVRRAKRNERKPNAE